MVRITLVDNNAVRLGLISRKLEGQGYEVVTHRASDSAWRLVQDDSPDLIVLDVWLETPQCGWNLLHRLKQEPATSHIPVIAYACAGAQPDQVVAQSYPGVAIVPQALDLNALTQQVEAALNCHPSPPAAAMISRHGEQGMFIQLLGGFRVATPTRVIADSEWRLRKNKSLIKLLALAPGHRLPREEIMDLLWPDLEPERAANNLYRALHQVRHVLEPNLRHQDRSSYLRLHNGFVLLAPRGSLWIDVETFRRGADAARQSKDPPLYEKALRLYTGDLLPEDRYDDWADGHREALKALRLALLVDLSIVREQRGEDYAAIKALQDVVGSDPAHEEAQARLMLLLAKTGDRYLALRQYHELCTALRREVDAEPELHTQALYRRIAEGSFPPTSESVS